MTSTNIEMSLNKNAFIFIRFYFIHNALTYMYVNNISII